MAFGDGIRRNIAHVEPSERALLRDAFVELNRRFFPGSRTDTIPGGVSWWFKQDEVHQATHVHGGPEFLPWHREIVNRLEALLRQINPMLSLHYWDWTQDPRAIPNANLGGGVTGTLNLFTPDFMGFGGNTQQDIGEPWLSAGYYDPGAANFRSEDPFDSVNNNPADPPRHVVRSVGEFGAPATVNGDNDLLDDTDYQSMRIKLENIHDSMHGFVNMGGQHTSFRDPFVFLLHSNVDRLFARWQTDPANPGRLNPATLYGVDAGDPRLFNDVEPWSGGAATRPWAAPENQQEAHNYFAPSVVAPPCYDTNHSNFHVLDAENPLNSATNRHQVLFNDVPELETTWRPAVVRVFTCGDTTFKIVPGTEPAPPFQVSTPTVHVPHGPNAYVDVRVWFQFTAGAVGSAPQTLAPVNTAIFCEQTGQQFPLELRANTIPRPTVAVQLSLDQSGSMAEPAGTSGASRLEVLKDAANLFANLVQAGNGIGIVRFDQDAYAPNHPSFGGLPMTRIVSDGFGDPGRISALNAITAHGAHGATSVGDGLEMARAQLNALPPGDYQRKAILVLTDGIENTPKSIAEVGPIDDRTYAVGLGNEFQVNTAALTALAGSTGGYLLLSGVLADSLDDQFRLRKFFLQILAGVTNTSIVRDPVGHVGAGSRVRIPFQLSEADIDCRVILMGDAWALRLSVETPAGELIHAGNSAGTALEFQQTGDLEVAHFVLPAKVPAGDAQAGIWHAILELDDRARLDDRKQLRDPKGARYCVSVHSYSNLRMEGRIDQQAFTPGSTLSLRAGLKEYGVPLERRAQVRAEVEFPDGSRTGLNLAETQPGVFEASFPGPLAGIYRVQLYAEGVTFRGTPFTREQMMTAALYHEVSRPPADSSGGADGGRLGELFAACCRRMTMLGAIAVLLLLIIAWALLRR